MATVPSFMPRRFLAGVLLALLAPHAAARDPVREAPDVAFTAAAALRASPEVPGAAETALVGALARRLEQRGAWSRVLIPGGSTYWVLDRDLVGMAAFTRLVSWNGPRRFEAGDGDYEATYEVRPDGSFVVTEAESDDADGYRQVRRRGHLHAHGQLLWARVGTEAPREERMFVRVGRAVCWQGYMDGRCPASR